MLEQAVIDAQALKEAAIKSAEQEVLEKYSTDIKEAVNSILEQDEDPLMGLGGEEEIDRDEIVNELPPKYAEGEKLCPCPEGEEEIEIDLHGLAVAASEEATEEEMPLGLEEVVFEASKSDIEELLNEDEKRMSKEECAKLPQEHPCHDVVDLPPLESVNEKKGKDQDGDGDVDSDDYLISKDKAIKAAKKEETNEEIELDEEIDEEALKKAIEEILTVDMKNVPRGDNGTTHPTNIEQVTAVEIAAAADEDTERKEENKEFDKAVKKIEKLEEQVKSLKSGKNRLLKEHNELKSIARQVSDKLTELNITNAKLVYQNRILESSSLNERQKQKLVDAVSNANSTEEAKVIYETLQDSLSSKADKAPKNLSEAVSKNNRLVLKSNNKETQVSNSATERMKKLAGII